MGYNNRTTEKKILKTFPTWKNIILYRGRGLQKTKTVFSSHNIAGVGLEVSEYIVTAQRVEIIYWSLIMSYATVQYYDW